MFWQSQITSSGCGYVFFSFSFWLTFLQPVRRRFCSAAFLMSFFFNVLEYLIKEDTVLMFALQAIPAMLLALVLCFDYRKSRDVVNLLELHSSKASKYIWYALPGYAIGLLAALAAGVLTHSPQPALLYLVRILILSHR